VTVPDPATFGEYKLTYRTGDIISPSIEPAEPLLLELTDFCRAIRSGSAPRSSSEIGLEVVRMIEAADSSLAQNGSRVELEATKLSAT
jgi:predicted dehydrogenase